MGIGEIIGIIFGVIFFAGIIVLAAFLRSPKFRGEIGEKKVSKILKQYVDEVGGYVIDDVILPYGNRTSQIDHVVFAPAGIFVIETKNWGGWIYGKDEDQYWTQTIGINRIQKHQHYNPVKQNYIHVKVLKVHTKEYERGKFYNVVVLTKNNTDNINSRHTVGTNELLDILRTFKEKRYSLSKLKEMYDRINYYVENPVVTHDQHVKSVRKDHPTI